MSGLRRIAAASVVALVSLVVVNACQEDEPTTSSATPEEPSTPLESFSTEGIVVRRDAFCAGIGPDAVSEALGTTHYRGRSYNNGDPARLAGRVRDVAHEFDCTWRAKDGTVARAWVFAPPVTRPQARELTRAALRSGCAATDGPAFGRPSVATSCASPDAIEQGYFGLFGDAWLSCTMTTRKPEPADLTQRTSHWCVAVVKAASGQTTG